MEDEVKEPEEGKDWQKLYESEKSKRENAEKERDEANATLLLRNNDTSKKAESLDDLLKKFRGC